MVSESIEASIKAFDPETPLARASTIPSAWYTQRDILQRERQWVFRNNWIYAGRLAQVAKPGDFFTTDIAGDPVLVTRDKKNQLHAMVNICRHRAARVECRSEGNTTRLRCRYHGWAYDLAGKLVGTPDFEGVENVDAMTMPKLAVDVWGPFVFVHFGDHYLSLHETLAPLPERQELFSASTLTFAGRSAYTMDCNWKVFIDNYLDGGYHIPTLHPGLAKVVRMDDYKTILYPRTNVQESPLKPSRDASLNKTRTGEKAYYWWIYPNFMINVYDGVIDTNWVVPLSEDKCLCVFEFYFQDVSSPTAKQFIADSLRIADQVQQEDMAICAEVQQGLSSSYYDRGRFSLRREAGGLHFHRLLATDLRKSL